MDDPDSVRRLQLGAFLRARREGLSAEAAGLPAGLRRRRTPGLRREELADLAGISAVWVARIEQGREVSASAAALARLAETLRLGRAERAHLFGLAVRRDPSVPPHAPPEDLPEALRIVAETAPSPAYVIDRFWQARAFSPAALSLFAGWLGGPEPNLLRYVFLDPSARRLIVDWEERARRLLAEFRADFGRQPGDAALTALVDDLSARDANFRLWWSGQQVLAREGGMRLFDTADGARLAYRQLTLTPADDPDFKLVLLLPCDGPGTLPTESSPGRNRP